MMAQIFGSIRQVFVFCFDSMHLVWNSIGGVRYLIYGVLAMLVVYRFMVVPILGHQSIVLPSSWGVDKPEQPKERYQNTGIGFTARW